MSCVAHKALSSTIRMIAVYSDVDGENGISARHVITIMACVVQRKRGIPQRVHAFSTGAAHKNFNAQGKKASPVSPTAATLCPPCRIMAPSALNAKPIGKPCAKYINAIARYPSERDRFT